MTQEVWTEDRIRSFLEEYRFNYQNVKLPYGLETGGNDRSSTADRIFPEDLTGKTVLDIGCKYGYFCFEAERRGAQRVVGVDISQENIEKCRIIGDIKGSNCEFIKLDIERGSLKESFDYVLCLNVLHHLRNPFSAIDNLALATKEVLILEVASFAWKDRRKIDAPAFAIPLLKTLPLIYLGDPNKNMREKSRFSSQNFYIPKRSMDILLTGQRRSFSKIEFIDEGYRDRYITIAHKRRINNLFVIAGIPTSGKSTFIKALCAGELPDIANQIGFDSSKEWVVRRYGDISRYEDGPLENVLLHFNLTQHLVDGDVYRFEQAMLDLFQIANRVSAATIWASPESLAKRYSAGRAQDAEPRRWKLRSKKNHRMQKKNRVIFNLLKNEPALVGLFVDWFDFLSDNTEESYLISQQDDNKMIKVDKNNARGILQDALK